MINCMTMHHEDDQQWRDKGAVSGGSWSIHHFGFKDDLDEMKSLSIVTEDKCRIMVKMIGGDLGKSSRGASGGVSSTTLSTPGSAKVFGKCQVVIHREAPCTLLNFSSTSKEGNFGRWKQIPFIATVPY